MRDVSRLLIIIALLCAVTVAISACGVVIERPTKIGKITSRGPDYLGQEVILEGTVKELVAGVPELIDYPGAFRLDDGTGDMIVLATGASPIVADELAVRGIVKRIIADGEEKLALQLQMTLLRTVGPNSLDYAIAFGAFIGGFIVIIWALNLSVFNWALPKKRPEGARTLSNIWSYGALFVYFWLCILFLFRGYNVIPVYILASFAGFVLLIGIVFAATTE